MTIFGSARTRPGHFVYAEVKRFARALAEIVVVPGGIGTALELDDRAFAMLDELGGHATGVDCILREPPFALVREAYVDPRSRASDGLARGVLRADRWRPLEHDLQRQWKGHS